MKEVTPKNLRKELKHYLELADKEPIRIKRRSGPKFILTSEEKFVHLKAELKAIKEILKNNNIDFKYDPAIDLPSTTKRLTKVTKKVLKKKVKAKKRILKKKNKKG